MPYDIPAADPPVRHRSRGEQRHRESAESRLAIHPPNANGASNSPDNPVSTTPASYPYRPADATGAIGATCDGYAATRP